MDDTKSNPQDDIAAVTEIFRVLKSGGSCVASVDNMMMYVINEMKSNHFERIQPLIVDHVKPPFVFGLQCTIKPIWLNYYTMKRLAY